MNDNLEQYQKQICRMCENKFFDGRSGMSYHSLCYGSHCGDAYDIFKESDEYFDLLIEKRDEIINKILGDD